MAAKWMSVAEAATVLEVSEATVRRRVRREMLESRTGSHGRMEVRLPEAAADAPPAEPAQPAEAADATDAGKARTDAPAPNPAKFGRYSPLPGHEVGVTPSDSGSRPGNRLTPGALLGKADGQGGGGASDLPAGPEAEMSRYQRLAGASMILAQRQADEAHEKVMLVRAEAQLWRRWCQGAFAAVAGVVLLALVGLGITTHRTSNAYAALEAQRELTISARGDAARIARHRNDLEQMIRALESQLETDNGDEAEAKAEADEAATSVDQRAAGVRVR
ncbi:MAG: hypothetical protein WDZ31_12415 [Phycisphaeraceae bacterium]